MKKLYSPKQSAASKTGMSHCIEKEREVIPEAKLKSRKGLSDYSLAFVDEYEN